MFKSTQSIFLVYLAVDISAQTQPKLMSLLCANIPELRFVHAQEQCFGRVTASKRGRVPTIVDAERCAPASSKHSFRLDSADNVRRDFFFGEDYTVYENFQQVVNGKCWHG